MATEPIQAGPYPVPTDAPDSPNQTKAVVDWAAPRLNMRFTTTTTRDAAIASPTEGMECVTGTGAAMVKWFYLNGAWGDVTVRPPAAYTPVLTAATTNPTLGTASVATGEYIQVGKKVTYWFNLTFGTSGTNAGSGNYAISLPVTASAAAFALGTSTPAGSAITMAAGGRTLCVPSLITTTTLRLLYANVAVGGSLVAVAHNLPGAFTINDNLRGFITYEAA